jgi:hypothetical protein
VISIWISDIDWARHFGKSAHQPNQSVDQIILCTFNPNRDRMQRSTGSDLRATSAIAMAIMTATEGYKGFDVVIEVMPELFSYSGGFQP